MDLGNKMAFPSDKSFEHDVDCEGMTYRQWLVGMALQGLLANEAVLRSADMLTKGGVEARALIAQTAIAQSEAVIAELSE